MQDTVYHVKSKVLFFGRTLSFEYFIDSFVPLSIIEVHPANRVYQACKTNQKRFKRVLTLAF